MFINDLLCNIKLEIKLFADDFELLVRPLSKETTQMEQDVILRRYLEIKI